MPVLNIRHYETPGGRLANLIWTGETDEQATVPFTPQLDRFDLEDVRWYHENYRENWRVSSNAIIERIQNAELNIGKALHAALFHGEAARLAAKIRSAAPDLRIEIRDQVHSAAVPWELIADPQTGDRLALAASSFVRATPDAAAVPVQNLSRTATRLLLVISRPAGSGDVGYWSVAYALWRELAHVPSVKLEVLRPATFDELERRLNDAARNGAPYTAVHFDGHGDIVDPFGAGRASGYLLFETAGRRGPEFIDGATVGRVLHAAGVLHFSMNACRSADSAAGDAHLRVQPERAPGQPSIVEDVLAEGVPSCIGMRREIYPGTATRFFRVFYPEFFGGRSAGEAARIARGRLQEDPLAAATLQEDIAPVHDWSIPVVGERAVIRLQNEGRQQDGPAQQTSSIPEDLSAPPVVGFDRAVLVLEDILAEAPLVLVHGPVLSGKSRLAVEYARWLSATSATALPVHFVRLSAIDTPASLAARMPSSNAPSPDVANADPTACAGALDGAGGILILDHADCLLPEAEAFLGAVLSSLNGSCRVIVTARAGSLSWLPKCRSVAPPAFYRGARAELGRRWAELNRIEFTVAEFYSLLFFSGGLPGVILLLLGAAHKLIASRKATAADIAAWLDDCNWEGIAELSAKPGAGLPSVETLVGGLVQDLSSVCNPEELAIVQALSRFHVCFDEISAGRLIAAGFPTGTAAYTASQVIGKLANAGLAVRVSNSAEPAWFLHPFLKLVASRLAGAAAPQAEDLAGLVVDTVARKCADLAARFRTDTAAVTDMLSLYKQNMSDALYSTVKNGRLELASHLTEGLCLHCRFVGDVDLEARILDFVLPYFIDTQSGALRPERKEIGRVVWDQAICLTAEWPRNRRPMQGSVRLVPPDNDHYAAGLWFRAVGSLGNAAVAFRMERDSPAKCPRYAPGDIECHLSEVVYNPVVPDTWTDALRESRSSYAARRKEDALGLARSRISEARIRLVMLLNREDYRFGDQNVAGRIELLPEDKAALEEIAALLREAQSEEGGQSAENRSQASMLWSRIILAHGDLTSAIGYFEEGAETMIAMQEASIWHHYWTFALALLRHGWVRRSHDMAVNAFQFAMQTGNMMLPTEIRKFCERLESAYPEVTS